MSEASMTIWRGSRSAHTPPASTKATSGIVCAASTTPSAVGPRSSVLMTANAKATGTSPSPSVEVVWPIQSSRNRRSRRAPNSSDVRIAVDSTYGALRRRLRRALHDERVRDLVVERLLALGERGHDVADEEDDPGDDLRERAPERPPERDPAAVEIGDLD